MGRNAFSGFRLAFQKGFSETACGFLEVVEGSCRSCGHGFSPVSKARAIRWCRAQVKNRHMSSEVRVLSLSADPAAALVGDAKLHEDTTDCNPGGQSGPFSRSNRSRAEETAASFSIAQLVSAFSGTRSVLPSGVSE